MLDGRAQHPYLGIQPRGALLYERRLDVIEFGEVAKALSVDPAKLLGRLYRETQ